MGESSWFFSARAQFSRSSSWWTAAQAKNSGAQHASPPFTLEINRGNPLEIKLRRAESVFPLGNNLGASGLGNSGDVAQSTFRNV